MGSNIPLSSQTPQQQDLVTRIKSNHFNTYFRDFSQIIFYNLKNNDQTNKNINLKKTLLRRHIILTDSNELNEFYQKYLHTQKIPFNILFPIQLVKWNGTSSGLDSVIQNRSNISNNNANLNTESNKMCSSSAIASVYFQPFMNNLVHYCMTKNKSTNKINYLIDSSRNCRNSTHSNNSNCLFNSIYNHDGLQQNQIWFIINQISHSIETLKNQKHAHWNITPQTIFYNQHQNWFIHDSYFVFGPNYENFLQYKFKIIKNSTKKCSSLKKSNLFEKTHMIFMSEQLNKRIEKGIIIDIQNGVSQDIYGLGNSILYAMGMQIQVLLQKNSLKRYQNSMNFLHYHLNQSEVYSQELIHLVSCMIQPLQNRRISINRIRQKLGPNEKKIISSSIAVFKKQASEDVIKLYKEKQYPKFLQKKLNRIKNEVQRPKQPPLKSMSTQNMIAYIENLPFKQRKNLKRQQYNNNLLDYQQRNKLPLNSTIKNTLQKNKKPQSIYENKTVLKHYSSLQKLH